MDNQSQKNIKMNSPEKKIKNKKTLVVVGSYNKIKII